MRILYQINYKPIICLCKQEEIARFEQSLVNYFFVPCLLLLPVLGAFLLSATAFLPRLGALAFFFLDAEEVVERRTTVLPSKF